MLCLLNETRPLEIMPESKCVLKGWHLRWRVRSDAVPSFISLYVSPVKDRPLEFYLRVQMCCRKEADTDVRGSQVNMSSLLSSPICTFPKDQTT
ncbi:hypothetical protein AVEN_223986-1 [Araneus ventricosus]|uniref:Uncharacterized protein n=1 Tax=Araneus ventricosus TaxID=182803 RepID=A0A4Y2L1K8_ARAVE|nr:hypothetical protein AVEN_223986-1 [Araneus ventricosus]